MIRITIFFIPIFLMIVCYAIKVNVVVQYLKNGNHDYLSIKFNALWGALQYQYEIPMVKLSESEIKLKNAHLDKKTNQKNKITHTKYSEILESVHRLHQPIRYTLKRMIIEKMKLQVKVGLGDAFYTGLAGGLLWIVMCSLYAWISFQVRIRKRSMQVDYNFNNKEFKVDFICIFNIKLVHIIIVGFWILFIYMVNRMKNKKKKGDEDGRTSNTGSYVDGYGKHQRHG